MSTDRIDSSNPGTEGASSSAASSEAVGTGSATSTHPAQRPIELQDLMDGRVVPTQLFELPFSNGPRPGGEGADLPEGTQQFNLQKFRDSLIGALDGNCAGFQWAIARNGQYLDADAHGIRRSELDGGPLPLRNSDEINIASALKPITGMAVLRACHERNIPVTTLISEFLPTFWKVNATMKDITIEHLLSHKSGLGTINASTSYEPLRDTWANGFAANQPQVGPAGTGSYDNRNFAIFRIALPYMVCKPYMLQLEASAFPEQAIALTTGALYTTIMRTYVFAPVGEPTSDMVPPPEPDGALAYDWPLGTYNGHDMGIWTHKGGGGGWVCSALTLVKVLAYFRHSTAIVPKEMRELMVNAALGWDTLSTKHGTAYNRFGQSGLTNGNRKGTVAADIFLLPKGFEAAIICNSNLINGASITSAMITAFEDAWE